MIQRSDVSSVPEPVIVAPTWPTMAGDAESNESTVTGLGWRLRSL